MKAKRKKIVPLPLDPETEFWLARLAHDTGSRPAAIVASILRDIRLDDEAAHTDETSPTKH